MYHRAADPSHVDMRARALATIAVLLCTIGATPAAAGAAPPIPRVRVTVPHVELPLPRAARPLAEGEWSRSSQLFERRLEAAGNPETLAVEEMMLAIGRARVRNVAKTCVDRAAHNVLEAEAAALASGQARPNREQLHDALEAEIDDCLEATAPGAAGPARNKMSGWLADQVLPPVDQAVQTSTTVNAPITWPSAGAGASTTTTDPGHDDASSFPWWVALVAAALGGALFLRARRRS